MKKRMLSAALAVVMAVSLAACGSPKGAGGETEKAETPSAQSIADTAAESVVESASESGGSSEQEMFKVAFICKSFSDTFCLSVKDEFEKAAGDYTGLFTVDYFDSENTAATQNDQIETCTAAGYNAIVFQQVDAEAPVEVVKAALDKGIYVIVTTGHVEDDGASWYVDADPYQQGQVVVDYAVEGGFCDNAEVAILSGPIGNFHSDNRVQAFKDALEKKEGTKLAATEVAEWSKDKAMTVAQNWLVAFPDLKVILAANDDMGMGAVEAIEMAGKQDQITVFAIDGTEAGLEAVAEGRLGATVKQDAKGYAIEAIKMAADLLQGKEADSMNIASTLVTKDNVADFQ